MFFLPSVFVAPFMVNGFKVTSSFSFFVSFLRSFFATLLSPLRQPLSHLVSSCPSSLRLFFSHLLRHSSFTFCCHPPPLRPPRLPECANRRGDKEARDTERNEDHKLTPATSSPRCVIITFLSFSTSTTITGKMAATPRVP